MKTFLPGALAAVMVFFPVAASAAEFDLDTGRVVLRQIQYCTRCGSALLVNAVSPGVLLRCPDCGGEERRIAQEYIHSQLYQACRLCGAPLDAAGRHAGDAVECGTCHTRQFLHRDAFALAGRENGPGYAPGFPPGSGEKLLLLSRADSPIAPAPLDDDGGPAVPDGFTLQTIPSPPEDPPAGTPPPLPGLVSSGEAGRAATAAATENRTDPTPADEIAASPQGRSSRGGPDAGQERAITVPAVTADLFGAPRKAPARAAGSVGASSRAVARVDDIPIYAHEVDLVMEPVVRRLRAANDSGTAGEGREAAVRREVLERLIDRVLVLREAEAIGFRADPQAVRERENELARRFAGTGVDIRREALRDVTMAAMRRRFGERSGGVSPSAVREWYRDHRDSLLRPRMIALDHLVLFEDRRGRGDSRPAQAIAFEISGLLEQGKRFDQLRDRYDEFVPASGLPHKEPELRPESAFAGQILRMGGDLRRGAVFGPLAMPGLVLFGKVADERPAGPIPFEEVEKEISRRLEEEAVERNFDQWLARLRQKANIAILE